MELGAVASVADITGLGAERDVVERAKQDREAFAVLYRSHCQAIGGYIYHTVPVALYAWYHHFGDFRNALLAVIRCGGDTDTAGAVVGALAGATVGASGIPERWITGIVDWPRSTAVVREAADRLAAASSGSASGPVRYFWPGVILRNVVFLVLVLGHGFRRLLPPY